MKKSRPQPIPRLTPGSTAPAPSPAASSHRSDSEIAATFTPSPQLLASKNILISAAATEIGQAVAVAAAAAGACVLLLARRSREARTTYDRICASGAPEPLLIEFDVARATEADFAVLGEQVMAMYPQLHGLVHCDWTGASLTPIAHADLQSWQAILDAQLIRPMYLTKTLYAALDHPRPSTVIFNVFTCGRAGRAYWGAIGAACAGLENLAQTMRAEGTAARLRVHSVDCSQVRIAARRQFYPAISDRALLRADDPQITNAYLYLLAATPETARVESVSLGGRE